MIKDELKRWGVRHKDIVKYASVEQSQISIALDEELCKRILDAARYLLEEKQNLLLTEVENADKK